uniref:Putative lectin/glucanase superfamily protein n=1 Tax=viral metagenome TaxID=1070528 RepID=A0A6M3J4A6_9ZZZZ
MTMDAKNLWSYNPLPNNCILWIPFWNQPATRGPKFITPDMYRRICTATGTEWRADGRYFDGLNDWVNCGDIAQGFDGVNNKLTAIAWVRPTEQTAGQFYAVAKYDDNLRTFYLNSTATGAVRGLVAKTGAASHYFYHTTDTTPISVDNWYCVGAVFDLANQLMTLYVDGSLVASTATVAGTPPIVFDDTTSVVEINSAKQGTLFGDAGYIGEVGLWTSLYSAEEMAYYYAKTRGRYK